MMRGDGCGIAAFSRRPILGSLPAQEEHNASIGTRVMSFNEGIAVAGGDEIIGGRQGGIDDAVPLLAGRRVGDGDPDAGGRGIVDDEEIIVVPVGLVRDRRGEPA